MVAAAFSQVQTSLRWYIDNFGVIADWRATLLRIAEFRAALTGLTQVARIIDRSGPRNAWFRASKPYQKTRDTPAPRQTRPPIPASISAPRVNFWISDTRKRKFSNCSTSIYGQNRPSQKEFKKGNKSNRDK